MGINEVRERYARAKMQKAGLAGANNKLVMRLYAGVRFLSSSKMNFTDREGNYVEYSENLLKGEGGTMRLNSKANYESCEGQDGVVEIEATEGEKGFKLTLKRFTEGESLEVPEGDID